ncbi:MAG: Gfo/Idh/MocA family oxidoreductase [Firmicutes bacterium]|nr:Gfo/Idh/MocA family oxidoreductase [Bacillota bacterium]
MNRLRYGLIGCGRISPNHVAGVQANQDSIELVAVCDLIPERMDLVLTQVGVDSEGVKKYTDYQTMLHTEQLDLVAIATESGSHARIGLDCINAGHHVIIEKPIALSIADADHLIEAASNKGVVLCSCHQNRFNKSIQKVREAYEQNRFGRLLHGAAHIRWNRGKQYYEQASWRGTWEQDGGALMNQSIHNIDLLRWMMGEDVEEVFAYTDRLKHDYIEAEDLGLALVKFSNGAYGLIEGTTNVHPKNLEETLYIFGDAGTVKVGGTSANIIEEWSFADQKDDPQEVKARYHENPPNVYGFGHTPLYQDVVSAIKEGQKPFVDGEAGKKAVELVLAIYKSALERRPVRLPLEEDFSTLDMANYFK